MYLLEIGKDLAKDLKLFFVRAQELNGLLGKDVAQETILFKIKLMFFFDNLLRNKTILEGFQRLITENEETFSNEKFNIMAKAIFNFSCTLAEERTAAELEQAKKSKKIDSKTFPEEGTQQQEKVRFSLDYTTKFAEHIQFFFDNHTTIPEDVLNIFKLKLAELRAYIKALALSINDQIARNRLGHVVFTFNCILHWTYSKDQTMVINYLDPGFHKNLSAKDLAEDYGKKSCPWLSDYAENLALITFRYSKYVNYENNANKILNNTRFYSVNLQILQQLKLNQFDYSNNINEIKACLLYLYQNSLIGNEIKITEGLNKLLGANDVNGNQLEEYISSHEKTITKILNEVLSVYHNDFSDKLMICRSTLDDDGMLKMIQVGINLIDLVNEIDTQHGWSSELVYGLTSGNFYSNKKCFSIANNLAALLGFNLKDIKDGANNEIQKEWQVMLTQLSVFLSIMRDLCNGNLLMPERIQSFSGIFTRLLDTHHQECNSIINQEQLASVYIEVLIYYARTVMLANEEVLVNLHKELSIGFLKSKIYEAPPFDLNMVQEEKHQKATPNTRGRSVRNLWRRPSKVNINERQNQNIPENINCEVRTSLDTSSSEEEKLQPESFRRKRNKNTKLDLTEGTGNSNGPGFFNKRDNNDNNSSEVIAKTFHHTK